MKKLFFVVVFVLVSLSSFSQDISVLIAEIESLKARVTVLENVIKSKSDSIKTSNAISQEKVINQEKKRCIATTTAGYQCSRNADEGSDYCWQHKKMYEPSSSTTSSKSSSVSNSSSSSRTIHTGPRGGKYYINSKGNKVYVKKK
jgi:colicin import membrane protein